LSIPRKTSIRWLAAFAALAVPYVVLMAAGTVWFYQRGWLWIFMAAAGVVHLLAGWGIRRLRVQAVPEGWKKAAKVELPDLWSPAGKQAWPEVEAIAQRVETEDVPLDGPESLWVILQEVFEAVARKFHPGTKSASLEVPIPQLLAVVELVARDLRQEVVKIMPASHVFTVNDLRRANTMISLGRKAYFLYRVLSMGFDPVSAIARELRDVAANKVVDASLGEVKRWALGYCVRRAGYYAVELYSGQLILDGEALKSFQSIRSTKDAEEAFKRGELLTEEPLRMLVLGQVKAGKSSLVNALFGDVRAAVDVVPRTRGVEPYVLEKDGLPRAVILDTAGYDAPGDESPLQPLRQELLRCDLVLVVVSARTAARAADRRLLDEVRHMFQSQPDRLLPPLFVVLTHVDQLRPAQEWNPPYDVVRPATDKARNIADAMNVVAADLEVPLEDVVPVCLLPGREYNVGTGLVPQVLSRLGDVQKVKYLRCLKQFQEEEYWRRLWEQAANSGQILVKKGLEWAGRLLKKVDV
jgi:hypothetical protein